MIAAILRLIALRPFIGMAILGIPILLLIAVGLLTILAFKFIVFIVLPIAAIVWLVRTIKRSSACKPDAGPDTGPDIAQ